MFRRFVILLAAIVCLPARMVAQGSIAIRDVTVIPMTERAPLTGQTVVVRDGRIAAIGPASAVRVPDGVTTVDGKGKYLIPGLFEMHGHTSKTRGSALGLYVVHGVTTLRDQGSEHAEVLRWRKEIRAGKRVGPRMLIAGPYLESLRNIERMRSDPPESRVEPFERARIPIGSPADAHRVIDSLAVLGLRIIQDPHGSGSRDLSRAWCRRARARQAAGGARAVETLALFLESGQSGVDHVFPTAIHSLPREARMTFWRELAARDSVPF